MNIKGFIKLAATFTGIAAAILVTDKVVDRIIDGKKEKTSENNDDSCSNGCETETETETEETTEVTESNKTIVKAAVKAVIVTFAGLTVFEYGLERGVTFGAAFFTKTPTTYEEAKELVSNPESFHTIMSLIRKAR